MKQPKILLTFLFIAAVVAWVGIYQVYLKPPSAVSDPTMAELTAFYNDLDMVHVDRVRTLCNEEGKQADTCYRVVAAQFGRAYLLKQHKGRVTPEMMRAFFRSTGFGAHYCVGREESYTFLIIRDDPDPALVEVAIENRYPYKKIWFTRSKSLLHLAVENDRFRLAQSLATKHPELLTLKDDDGRTPLDIARKQGKAKFTELLSKAQKHG